MSTCPTKPLSCHFFPSADSGLSPSAFLPQSHTSCCFGALCPIRRLRDERLRSFKGTAPRSAATEQLIEKPEIMLTVFNTALRGSDTLQRADHAGTRRRTPVFMNSGCGTEEEEEPETKLWERAPEAL